MSDSSLSQKPIPVHLAVDPGASSDTCLFLPPKVLLDVRLPSRLIISGAGGPRLVSSKRVDGPDDACALGVSQALLDYLVPDHGHDPVPADLRKASWRDLYAVMGRAAKLRILAAIVLFLAAVAVAVVSIITLKLPGWIIVAVLVIVSVGAAITAWREVRDAITPKCG